MSAFVSRNDTFTAEVWWALGVNSSNYSYKSCEDIAFLAQQMFLDSDTVRNSPVGRKRLLILIVLGLLHTSRVFYKKVKSLGGYVPLYDESLNYELQKKHLESF